MSERAVGTNLPTIGRRVAEQLYGAIVFEDDTRVVRVSTNEDGHLMVKVHKKEGGFERLPRGYMLGANILQHKG